MMANSGVDIFVGVKSNRLISNEDFQTKKRAGESGGGGRLDRLRRSLHTEISIG